MDMDLLISITSFPPLDRKCMRRSEVGETEKAGPLAQAVGPGRTRTAGRMLVETEGPCWMELTIVLW